SLKTLYRKRTVIWPFYFYTIIRTLSSDELFDMKEIINFNQIIGKVHIDNVYIETRKGKVHYSKTGAHIVPYIDK
ncbi:polymorphic toxin type 50 domain-containing protein, partial [Staphylococcus aureus]|uniref:polymorphic toxin type 50 domain-containing protein n=1 Tax=Staphylococcus aureus TaxID=1280 RepID=UPI003F42FB52